MLLIDCIFLPFSFLVGFFLLDLSFYVYVL